MRQLFISHAQEDGALAKEIGAALEQRGFTAWHYGRDCVPGPSYLRQIIAAIKQCEGVILIISPSSLGSHQVDAEVTRAFDAGKRFVPLLSGLSYEEFEERMPEWAMALRAATCIRLPPAGVASILPQLERGVLMLGVKPASEPAPSAAEAPRGQTGEVKPPKSRKAYLCYASEDYEEVLKRAQALSSTTDMIVTADFTLGGPARDITEEVDQLIAEADIFFLFWSEAASRSMHVRAAVRYALDLKKQSPAGLPEIVPVALDHTTPPTPSELDSLYFGTLSTSLLRPWGSRPKK